MNVLADTGAFVAMFDPDDRWHSRTLAALDTLPGGAQLITSLAVVTETTHLLDFDLRNQFAFLDWLAAGGARVRDIPPEGIKACRARMEKYADRPMDFADATLVWLAEQEDLTQVMSVDADFDVYKIGRKKLVNLISRV
ncbi:MAG: PIN domain-containing protein [Thiobacillus sp.]